VDSRDIISLQLESDLARLGPAVDEALAALAAELSGGSRRRISGSVSDPDIRALEVGRAEADAAALLDAVRMALTEALNNCVLHGYGGAAERPIEVHLRRMPGAVAITVVDRGIPLPEELLVPRPIRAPDEAVAALPECGWGWAIIHQSVDRVRYVRRDGENRLTLEKRLPHG